MPELIFGHDLKFVLGILSALMFLPMMIYYVGTIIWGKTKPHPYTYVVWSTVSGIGTFAQLHGDGGYGVILTACVSLTCAFIAVLGFIKNPSIIKKSDIYALAFCLIAIVLWQITKTPLWSVFIICVIDAVAIVPTVRKSWNDPYNENALTFAVDGFAFIISILALREYNLITTMYPLTIMTVDWALAGILLLRRYQLYHAKQT